MYEENLGEECQRFNMQSSLRKKLSTSQETFKLVVKEKSEKTDSVNISRKI